MTVSAASHVNLPGFDNQASSLGQGDLYGTFMITGGSGSVDVLFSMDVEGSLYGFTDEVGSFDPDWIAGLWLDGAPILFDYQSLSGGPNFTDPAQTVTETLSNIVSLSLDTSHFLYIGTDPKSPRNQNMPEPGTFVLALIGEQWGRENNGDALNI